MVEQLTAGELERFLQYLTGQGRPIRSHESLIGTLLEDGYLSSAPVLAAFRAVKREDFLTDECSEWAYHNAPVRCRRLHQSAPTVYANALEALELTRGLSFLNIGSGTGYFSALVAQLIGPRAINIGLERHLELVQHARSRCEALGMSDIEFVHGNCYLLDPDSSMRFDRIYIGAGAPHDARFLFKCLKPGGLLVGPFEDERGLASQTLLKVYSSLCGTFTCAPQASVVYAWLVKPGERRDREDSEVLAIDTTPIVLLGPQWSASSAGRFPASFQRTVIVLYWMANTVPESILGRLPWYCWTKQILVWLPCDSFEPYRRQEGAALLQKSLAVAAGPSAST